MKLYIWYIFNTLIIYIHIYIWYIYIYIQYIHKIHSSANFITHIPKPDLSDCKDL